MYVLVGPAAVMWQAGGRAYVYLIYGMWNQFAVVVNTEGVPDVVFIRAIAPLEGVEVMTRQWDKPVAPAALTNSLGSCANPCCSAAISTGSTCAGMSCS
jgi:3-methyladenine DNA glycosylase Mpg